MENTHLFSPLKIRDLTLKNRIVVSPMQQYIATDGLVNNWHLVHLGSRAVGGASLIITECTAVSPDGMNTPNDTGLWNDAQVQAWKPIIQFVQDQGTKIAVQLWHSGAKGSHSHPRDGFKYLTPEEGGWIPKSSSPIALNENLFSEVLTIDEIQKIKSDFVAASLRAVDAGFDSIELHAGHGYLFHQFYTSLVNQRTDEYGGSFENRIRLLTETVKEIRKAIPEGMPLLVRISAVDYVDGPDAWNLDDSVKLSGILKDLGVDQITTSGGGFASWNNIKIFPSYQVPFAAKVKAETGIFTGAVGAINDPEQANEIISSGKADLVVIAKEFLRNPHFPINAALALGYEIDLPEPYLRAY